MLALADNVQGVDCRDTGGRLKVYRSEAPVVIFVLTQLGGSAEADRRVGLTLGTYSFRDLVRRRGEDGFVVMQTLEELIACVLAAVGQGQLFTVQLLVGSSQLIRNIAYTETGDPGAPCQIIQRVLHHDTTLPVRLGQLPDIRHRRTVRISFTVVEQLRQLDIHRGLRLGVLFINVRQDICRLVVIELARQNILVVQCTVLILDMHHIGNVLTGIILKGDLFQQLVGGNIERLYFNAGILLHEGIGDLGDTGGNRIDGYLALFLRLLVQFLIGLIRVEDTGGLFPLAQLERARCRCLIRILRGIAARVLRRSASAARGQREHHCCCQNTC